MPFADIHNALPLLQRLPAFGQMTAAINVAPMASAAQFRASLEVAWRNTAAGWSANEFRFTPIQPQGRGRPRAIDFCNLRDRVGIELELSNQNAVSHDLMKLETAYGNNLTSCGVLVVPTVETRDANQWYGYDYYATFEYAEEWLRIYTPSLRSPIVVWGV